MFLPSERAVERVAIENAAVFCGAVECINNVGFSNLVECGMGCESSE